MQIRTSLKYHLPRISWANVRKRNTQLPDEKTGKKAQSSMTCTSVNWTKSLERQLDSACKDEKCRCLLIQSSLPGNESYRWTCTHNDVCIRLLIAATFVGAKMGNPDVVNTGLVKQTNASGKMSDLQGKLREFFLPFERKQPSIYSLLHFYGKKREIRIYANQCLKIN